MTKTSNYQLNQWSAADAVRMADFNADNQKLDTALKALDSRAKIVTGTYTGTGTFGAGSPTSVTFPFPPKLVFITSESDQVVLTLRAITGMAEAVVYTNFLYSEGRCRNVLTWSGNTLRWYCTESETFQLNVNNQKYFYFAVG